MPEEWWDYVARIAGPDATQKDISEHTGIEQSSISRWKLGKNTPNADAVVRFARSYGQNPVAALIAAGYLELDEVEGAIEIAGAATSELSTSELLGRLREDFGELQRRVPEVGAIVNESEDWPEGFFDGVSDKPPPIRRRKNRQHRT